jgi:enterobacteria phage integrase
MKRKSGLRYVEHMRDRHGKMRFYFRRGKGKRIPMPGIYRSDEFMAAYAAALSDAAQSAVERPKVDAVRATAGTLAALIVDYMKSAPWRDLADTTKVAYAGRLSIIRREHGHRTVLGLTRDRIEEKILKPLDDRPGAKAFTLKMIRVLIRHAIRNKVIATDPSLGVVKPKGGEVRSWTDAELAQFEAHWPLGTRQRTAYALHLYTGQRRSDVHRMTWSDIIGPDIRVVQQKTGAKLTIRLHRELSKALAVQTRSRRSVQIIATERGPAFTVAGYSQWMRDAITAAGLPLDAQPHGLRKAAGRRLADAGCTAREIMAILGHTSLSEAERYTREADQARLARSAMLKLEQQIEQTSTEVSPNRVVGFGEKS